MSKVFHIVVALLLYQTGMWLLDMMMIFLGRIIDDDPLRSAMNG